MTHFAREYGNALFELAMEEKIAEEVAAQLEMLEQCFSQQPDYIRLLCTRSIDSDTRIALLDQAFGGQVHAYLINFMKILIGRGAMDYFNECAQVYRVRFNEAFGIAEAVVTSAAPLDEPQLAALKEKLSAMAGKQVKIHTQVDPQLIGGMQVDLEGRRYDNSIRTRLDGLRRTLTDSE